eukprot:SAG22_NODE_3282_length_1806_cov_2.055653_2_plen_456_part_00
MLSLAALACTAAAAAAPSGGSASPPDTPAGPAPAPLPPVTLEIDWTTETRRTSTAATVEVDVMPFLARQPQTDPYVTDHHYGGPFDKYYAALQNLNASFVRFAPWCPNPRLVVPELTPPDCTSTMPATNWNSTFFDQLMLDFMTAVCGDGAQAGSCDRLSVILQLSTMPSWMYVGGMDLAEVPENPYVPTRKGHKEYEEGGALKDTSCESMASHIGRVVGWYTNGGFHDDCGHWHKSSFKYKWYGLSILNEDEHGIKPEGGGETARHWTLRSRCRSPLRCVLGLLAASLSLSVCFLSFAPSLLSFSLSLSLHCCLTADYLDGCLAVAYTTCFDAVVKQLQKINSTIIPVGPEISGGCSYPGGQFDYLSYALNKSHHVDEYTPLIGSYHIGINGDGLSMPGSAEGFYTQWDGALRGFVPAADKLLVDLKSPAKLILNEFVNSVQDWCDKTDATHGR